MRAARAGWNRWSRRSRFIAAGVCIALLVTAAWGLRRHLDQAQRARGAALFHGDLPLVARLQGHARPLPSMAARCSNCHDALSAAPRGAAASAGGGVDPSRPYADLIRGAALTTPRVRRGGPPTAYDEASLCELLRTGVDPAHVMIPNAMPRYEPTPSDCSALWAYLRDEPS